MPASKHSKVHLVGGGIASLAAAAFLVRDAGVPGENVRILEQRPAADGARAPTREGGHVTRYDPMFEDEHCVCLWNLLETIPTPDDPAASVRQEIRAFNAERPTHARARLVNGDRTIADASELGLDARDRVDLTRLLALPERLIGTRRVDDFFRPHFFTTHFWCMWSTTFAFQAWHSAVELKRHLLAFVQDFDRLHTLSGVRRTRYDPYDSVVRPIREWLTARGVRTDFGVTVADADFSGPAARRLSRLHLRRDGAEAGTIELGEDDYAFLTLGSASADTAYGDSTTVPELVRGRRDGSWRLWESIARNAPDFGRPTAFCGNIEETRRESFTLTTTGSLLLDRIQKYTGNVPGEGALMTWKDSRWLLSVAVPPQPHFRDQEEDTYILWGYALSGGVPGDHVPKTMDACTGAEVLDELLGHLGFDDIADEVRETTRVTTVQMPYAGAPFQRRAASDRPLVVPDGAVNFAFLGRFVEIPEGAVSAVEYAVRSAMIAVHHHFGVDRGIPPMYHGLSDPEVARSALRTALA
ncbi:oleate hydratase [Streptomyces sp. WAC00288]|uniref:oleate hydratase n=1 Tax=unclassified Streptomyces TaxID=2593676 RepID=UPI0007882C55|nr:MULTISPECIES: oleate hydratase [unclassified Streptomyces]AVH98825.1 oleate hydratase [Streptomyces sp. WAC00288]KYG52275.1 oleate hydratase [Streptomyces sp. WAC04657]